MGKVFAGSEKYLPGKPYEAGKQYDFEYGAMDDLSIYQLAGWWSEPEAPPPATAALQVGQGLTSVPKLLLKANVPSTITLQGPKDLLFSAFTVKLTALPLTRNLAKPEWGSSRSITGDSTPKQEILFAGPARVTAVGMRTTKTVSDPVKVDHMENTSARTYVNSMDLSTKATYKGKQKITTTSGYHEQDVVVSHLRFSLLDESADLLIASPSLPSRVGIALGDDTPAQLFPVEMELNGSLTSRDLTGQINAAWKRGAAGENAEVKLRITSLTDGVVQVDLAGVWGRSFSGQEVELALDAINPATLQEGWPFGTTVPDARASLRLTGRIEGGRRLGLVTGAPTFHVRTTERLEAAQALRIASGEPPVAKRQLLAVWLMVPALPRAEERLEIRLAGAIGDPVFPADEPLARMDVLLPVDAAAYVPEGGGYWYRAALEKPVELDGTQATSPLFVVAAGRESGTLLAHRSLGAEPEPTLRAPTGAGLGAGLVRNLDRTGQWEAQAFNRQAAHWLIDLELAPTPDEYGSLMAFAYGAGPLQTLPLEGANRIALDTAAQAVAQPAGAGTVMVTVASAVRALLTAQLFLYKPIRE